MGNSIIEASLSSQPRSLVLKDNFALKKPDH